MAAKVAADVVTAAIARAAPSPAPRKKKMAHVVAVVSTTVIAAMIMSMRTTGSLMLTVRTPTP